MKRISAFENTQQTVVKVFDTAELCPVQLESTSKGNQRKWFTSDGCIFVKEQFLYQGVLWRDDLVEVIASTIAQQMNLFGVRVIQQSPCCILDYGGETRGVFSEVFGKNKRFVSYKRLMDANGFGFNEHGSIEDKWGSVVQGIRSSTGLDYTNYLVVMSLLDYLVGNEDRHLNNFGVLVDSNGNYSEAPLFDFGLGLFEHDMVYEGIPFRECVDRMQCKPFNRANQKTIDWLSGWVDLKSFFNGGLDLSGCEIPSMKAGSYLRNRCGKLGIELRGVE